MTHVEELIEERGLNSKGAITGFAIDHFGLENKELVDLTTRAGWSEATVLDYLLDAESKGHSLEESIQAVYNQVEEIEEERLQTRIENYKKKSNAEHFIDLEQEIVDSMTREPLKTGFDTFDRILCGGLRSGLFVFGAIPSLGKTTFVIQICDRLAHYGTDVLFFSLEMSRIDLMARSLSRLTVYHYDDLGMPTPFDKKTAMQILDGKRYENYSEREMEIINRAKKEYKEYAHRIFIREGAVGIKEIEQAVETHIEILQRTPVVVIDYLQLMTPADTRATDKQNIDRIVMGLKRLSNEFKCPVMVVSSFNRANYNTEVSYGSFKESGSVEYGADVIVGMQLEGVGRADFDVNEEKKKYPREVEAVILKNRFGETGEKIHLQYFPAVNYFRERSDFT